MASKLKSLSVLVEDQLPDFIATEYPKFGAFLQKYYEHMELPGQPYDLIANLPKYRNVDTYADKVLRFNNVLTATISGSATTIVVEDATSFPKKNGYILINDEVIFYESRTDTTFENCHRNVSATTKLGDIYESSTFKDVAYDEFGIGVEHITGTEVFNVTNLFLYALIQNFEKEYLSSFPTRELDERTNRTQLIKNIKNFYSTKGTEASIGFIFQSIVSKSQYVPGIDVPSVYYPKNSTLKSSTADWITTYSLKVKILNANPTDLIGEKIVQESNIYDTEAENAFAIIDNIINIGNGFYELILSDANIVGQFSVISSTKLVKSVLTTNSTDNRINVYSTAGWNTDSGAIEIGNEVITYKDKTVNQFVINQRGSSTAYNVDTEVYSYSNVYVEYGNNQKAKILVLGILYNLLPTNKVPYSLESDLLQVSGSGFETRDRIIYNSASEQIRWILNESNATATATVSGLNEVLHSVSAIFEDEQYYYIASSGYPSHSVGTGSWTQPLQDQKHLKLIRKYPTKTTEVYETPANEVGILVNGTTVRSYKGKDEDLVVFGEITNIEVTNQGSGYVNPPYILIQNADGEIVASAEAVLNGEVVEKINVLESGSGFFPPVPAITITSGRNAVAEAIVTRDKVTGLVLKNPGEYYSSPPRVIIRDTKGKGRFASYTAEINNSGQITGFVKNSEGKFYTQENIEVIIEPVGSGATATSIVRTWRKNLVFQYSNQLDSNYGFYFQNNIPALGYGYSYLANPKALRVLLSDNLDNMGAVPGVLTHSPILGYAFDGNPIYGPYGYSDPLSASSSISRMTTSYKLNTSRSNGPSVSAYPLGSFVEDYTYTHRFGSLDENNGRFCVTPEYPEGTYAYFVSIDAANTPVFPYIVGKNFYSLPIDSNYNKNISQSLLPQNISRLRTGQTQNIGEDVSGIIEQTSSGSVTGVSVESSQNIFSVNNTVYFDNSTTNGTDASAFVSSVKGKSVTSIESQQTQAIKIESRNPVYLFDGDILTQNTTNASGTIVGDVFDGKTIVLRNCSGTFNKIDTLYSNTAVKNLIIDKTSDYTLNSEITLTNGKQILLQSVSSNTITVTANPFEDGEPIIFSSAFSGISTNTLYYVVNSTAVSFKVASTPNGSPITLTNNSSPGSVAISQKAKAVVLENVLQRNSVKIKILQGVFEIDSNYYLTSNNLSDTVGSKIVSINPLSSDIEILSSNTKVAIVSTSEEHGVSKGEKVNINISPNDTTTTTTIYARRRIYQKVKLNTPSYTKSIVDTGLGRLNILNNGSYSSSYTISQVARSSNVATITTSSSHGLVIGDQVTINKVPGYSATNVTVASVPTSTSFTYSNIGSNEQTTSVSIGTVTLAMGDYAYTSPGRNNTFNNVELLFADIRNARDVEGRIVGDSDLATIGRPGSIDNARANITVTKGIVTGINITVKGKGYKKGDLLAVNSSSLNRDPASTSTRFLIMEVDHVGFSDSNTILYLNSTDLISTNDYLQIGEEIVKVSSINTVASSVTVLRAQKSTLAIDHFNGTDVKSSGLSYKLSTGYQLGSNPADPYVVEYDDTTGELMVAFGVDRLLSNISQLVPNAAFFDENTPTKLVTVSDNSESPKYKYEFSYDNTNWDRNPILNLQNFYSYKFDTSHYTLRDSFLEFSPSGNFNILTTETVRNSILPGNAGSFITFKAGFWPAISTNTFVDKVPQEYNTFFYFDKSNIIDSDDSYIRIIPDPLQGEKTTVYVTPTKFVYEMDSDPEYDGSGNMSYTTSAILAVGQINSIEMKNTGIGYTSLPIISGVSPAFSNECIASVVWNSVAQNIVSVNIISGGKNYSKPKAILLGSSGVSATFELSTDANGTIKNIVVTNAGKNYTSQPEIKIIETDNKTYAYSNDIGLPKSIKLLTNGKNINRDKSLSRQYTGTRILVLKNISKDFSEGERIQQFEGSTLIASGYVARNGYRSNTNILRLRDVTGTFKIGGNITGVYSASTAIIRESLVSIFDANITSYFDNFGKYTSDKGHLSSGEQKLTDSYLYQDYSYVIKSHTPIDLWRDVVKQTVHPAGFELFGEVTIESEGQNRVPDLQPKTSSISIVQLWDPTQNKISVENTFRTLTQTSVRMSDINVLKGSGSVYAPAFDTGETVAYELSLSPNFDGYFNAQGNRQGTTTFTINLIGSNTPYSVAKNENLILTLDGILQEPGIAYTVSGTQITFTQAPLGYRSVSGGPISFASYKEGVDSPAQKALLRVIRFKDNTLNNTYFRKIKDISSQFNNSATEFDLYYEDDTPVNLTANENLIIAIDGILQRAGLTPVLPLDRSYYIRKTVVPNKLVFIEAPREFDSQKQSFYGFSVGSYERLKLDERYLDGTNNGPYILRSAVSNKTISVDEDRNVLVFVDQVLQKRNRDYTIRGSNITFTNPVLVGQQINILYLYGKETAGVVTAFDFETTRWYNRVAITFNGTPDLDRFGVATSNSAKGYIMDSYQSGGTTTIIVDRNNGNFVNSENIIITRPNSDYPPYTVLSSNIVTIGSPEENDNQQQYLRKTAPWWLKDHPDLYTNEDILQKGDQIKIDGESEYRTILSIPEKVLKTDYRAEDYLNTSLFGKISTTNYNGIARGEGLDVVAEISGGKVTNLLWNRIDWDDVYTKKILPSAPGYGYETAPQLQFVAQPQRDVAGNITAPPQGGGARAYVIAHAGEIVDIVLYDQGSGYLVPPAVYVTRNYDVIKKPRNISSVSIVNLAPFIDIGSGLFASTGDRLDADVPPQVSIFGLVVLSPLESFEQITSIVTPTAIDNRMSTSVIVSSVSVVEAGTLDVSSISVTTVAFSRSISTPLEVLTFTNATLNSVSDEYLSILSTFAKVNYLLAYKSIHETGAYLTASMTDTIDIAYIADTSKFLDSGRLLIEDEVVSYKSKLSDRFLNLLRGDLSTTAKSHAAGSFVRQYSDQVSIIDAGIDDIIPIIEPTLSIATLADASANITVITQILSDTSTQTTNLEALSVIQSTIDNTISDNAATTVLEVDIAITLDRSDITTQYDHLTIIEYGQGSVITTISSVGAELKYTVPAGFFDYFTENVVLQDPILTRSNQDIAFSTFFGDGSLPETEFIFSNDLYLGVNKNEVDTRSSGMIAVSNFDYQDSYEIHRLTGPTNLAVVGASIQQVDTWAFIDDGTADVSAPNFGELEITMAGYTIEDIINAPLRVYSPSSGSFYNMGYPSIQNPIAIPFSYGFVSSTIEVPTTASFPDTGYLFTQNGGVIQYTGKTSTSFTGCTSVRGSTTIRGNSVVFDATGDGLSLASSALFGWGTGTFTIEAWIYRTTSGAYQTIFDQRAAAATEVAVTLGIDNLNRLYAYVNGAVVIQSSSSVSVNTWTHVAICKSGNSLRIFQDGTQVGTTFTDNNNYTNKPIRIGLDYSGGFGFGGNIASFRVVKGTALYASTFTVPSQITNISGTSLLTCQGNTIKDRSSNNLTITVNGDATVSSTGTEIVPYSI